MLKLGFIGIMEDFKSSNWHSMEIGGWFGYIGNFPVSVRGGVGLLAASTVTFLNWFFLLLLLFTQPT